MHRFETLEELTAFVKNEGCVTVTAGHIRSLCGYDRLGSVVRQCISRNLEELNIRHYPADFPDSQYAFVRLVPQASMLDDLIEAILTPTPKTDALLRALQPQPEEQRIPFRTEKRVVANMFELLKQLQDCYTRVEKNRRDADAADAEPESGEELAG